MQHAHYLRRSRADQWHEQHLTSGFGATVFKTVRPMLSDRCPVCPVCDVGVLWPSGSMDQDKLGVQVGLGPVHIVLDGAQLPFPQRGTAPPIFGPYLLWPN